MRAPCRVYGCLWRVRGGGGEEQQQQQWRAPLKTNARIARAFVFDIDVRSAGSRCRRDRQTAAADQGINWQFAGLAEVNSDEVAHSG